MQNADRLRDVGGLRGLQEDGEKVGDDIFVAQSNDDDGAVRTAGPLDAFDEGVGEAAGGFKLAGLDAVGAADLPPGVLELGEEALGVLNVQAAAIDSYGERGVEARDGGLIVDGADDEIVLAAVGASCRRRW